MIDAPDKDEYTYSDEKIGERFKRGSEDKYEPNKNILSMNEIKLKNYMKSLNKLKENIDVIDFLLIKREIKYVVENGLYKSHEVIEYLIALDKILVTKATGFNASLHKINSLRELINDTTYNYLGDKERYFVMNCYIQAKQDLIRFSTKLSL